MATITYFFRKMTPGAYSINQAFGVLADSVGRTLQVQQHHLQRNGARPGVLLANIMEARRAANTDIHHITGDVHYLTLGLRGDRTVLSIHDCILLARTSRLNPIYYLYLWLWYKIPVRRAQVITTISEKSKNEIVSFTRCDPKKIKIIPNFVHQAFRRQEKPFNKTCPRILHIGLFANKNLERVATALEGIPCTLEIIGDLQQEHYALLQCHHIDFESCSNIPVEEMARRYRNADMLVFASTYEGFGLPIVEAQATGRPVVTSNIEPMPWVAGEKGACFVDPFNVTSIREGILRVIEDDHFRDELIKIGLENVQRFTLQEITRKYLEIYTEILKSTCAG